MHIILRSLTILLFYSTAIFGADSRNKNEAFTPTDIWIPIFNCLSLQDQYHLSLTCKSLFVIFDHPLVCAHDGYSGNFDTQNGLVNKVKNWFIPQRTEDANRHCTTFCKKIAANKIGGNVSFNCWSIQQLSQFFASLEKNNRIQKLTINGCLRGPQAGILADNSEQNQSLKSLHLPNNLITYKWVFYILKTLPQLEELNVSGCLLPATNKEFKTLIPFMYNLKKLHMNNCLLSGDQTEWIVDFLKTNTKLEELYLAGNEIDDGNFGHHVALIQAADTDNNPLKIIDLSDNHVLDTFTYDVKRKNLRVII